MPAFKPYFYIKKDENSYPAVYHNCDGQIGFTACKQVSEEIVQLIEFAIEEGKRRKNKEILSILGIN